MEAELKELIAKKDELEAQIAKLTSDLALADETKGLGRGLVDAEGFPRNDLNFGELVDYRNLKRRKAELNNDHLALMKQIEARLFALHATYAPPAARSETDQPHAAPKTTKQPQRVYEEPQKEEAQKAEQGSKIDYLTPFAKLGAVEEGSPARRGGLAAGDLVSEFAEINVYSMDWMKQIASAVREGIAVRLVVMRKVSASEQHAAPVFTLKDGEEYYRLELHLTPARWEGRGLLGCKIDPL